MGLLCSLLLGTAQVHGAITLANINVDVPGPVGIGYQPGSPDYLVLSVNYASGWPNNFARLSQSGLLTPFSPAAGFLDEIHLCTVRAAFAGFQAGDVFSSNGEPGTVARISADGTEQRDWCVLRTANYAEPGIVWGLCLDETPTHVFGGDLIATTEAGGVWRVNSSGVPTFVCRVVNAAMVPLPLESCVVVPNDSLKYGSAWAGKTLAGVAAHEN